MEINKKLYSFTLILLIISQCSLGQVVISGKVFDAETKLPLSGCTVFLERNKKGTIANEDGEFELSISNREEIISFSFLGYKPELVNLKDKNINNLEVFLIPGSIELGEAVVGNPVYAILRGAIEKSIQNLELSKFFKGYLKSTITENSKPKSFNEIFFDGEWASLGIKNWKPSENRYALEEDMLYKSESVFNFFSSFVRTGSIINSKILPNSPESNLGLYNLKIKNRYKIDNGNEIVEIQCIPKKREKPFFEGSIFINTSSENILKVAGTYYQEKTKHNIAKNQTYRYEVNFKESSAEDPTFDSFKITMKAKVKSVNIEENVLIYNIENYDSKIRGLSNVRNSQGKLMQKEYNPSFWTDNNVIKYTSTQSDFIKHFEKRGKFTSNFLKE